MRSPLTAPLPCAVMALSLATAGCESGAGSGDLGRVLGEIAEAGATQGATRGAVSGLEVEQGLREALRVGTRRVAGQLGQTDGYFGDPDIRIPLPGRLGEMQSTLSRVGLSAPLDNLQLRLNRSAEAAVPQAKALVLDAVSSITLDDAMGILNGGDTAATQFLRTRTEDELRAAFTPHMKSALQSSGAFASLDQVASQNGLAGVTNSLRDDLTTRAVEEGLDGLFHYVAREETRIRENPAARTSDILRKVFGASS